MPLYAGLSLLFLQQALASNVMLAWNPSPDPQVTNYNLYCGVASGVYTNQVAVGNTSSYQFTGLVPGVTYYFAVNAEDSNGLESPNSNEINYFVPLLPCNITLGNLNQVYSGQPAVVTSSTAPTNLPVTFSYNGSPSAPTNAGTYTVIATVVSATYTGAATNTLIVAQATATVQLSKLLQTWSGNPCQPSVVTVPAGLNVNISYDGSNQPPTDIGYYAVVASINDPNYTGTVSATFSIETVAPPSKLIIISWSAAFSPVTLLESTNLADWVTNTDLPDTASTNPSDTITTPVAIQDGNHFFRAVANGAGVPIRIN